MNRDTLNYGISKLNENTFLLIDQKTNGQYKVQLKPFDIIDYTILVDQEMGEVRNHYIYTKNVDNDGSQEIRIPTVDGQCLFLEMRAMRYGTELTYSWQCD